MSVIRKIFIHSVVCMLLCGYALSADIFIKVTQTPQRTIFLLMQDTLVVGDVKEVDASLLDSVIERDLTRSGFFTIQHTDSLLSDTDVTTGLPYDVRVQANMDYVFSGALTGGDTPVFIGKVIDVATKQTIMEKRWYVKPASVRRVAHTVADDVMVLLTGHQGINTSRIVFISDATGKKEVWTMDYDGENREQITHYNSITLLPRWCPHSRDIIYTSYVHGNPDLFRYNANEKTHTPLSIRQGLNTAASFSPDGERIAITLTIRGNPEICLLNAEGKFLQQCTDNYSLDTAPSFSPDGKKIVFISDRAGTPQVYAMDPDGGHTTQLTFDATAKDSPEWSPTGESIVYTSNSAGNKNICVVDCVTTNVQQLTNKSGNNENPTWAPDGRFICCSSTRNGKAELFVMRADGSNQQRMVDMKGNASSPKWQ